MNRNTILGWILLMTLFLAWTKFKGDQARKQLEHSQQQKSDSLAQARARAPQPQPESAAVAAPAPASATSSLTPASAAPVTDSTAVPHRLIRVETPRFTAVLDNQGARIAELSISSLEGKPVYNPDLIEPDGPGALTLTLDSESLAKTIWRVDDTDRVVHVDSDSVTISFATVVPQGKVTCRYTFYPNRPAIGHQVILPSGISNYALNWKGGLEETEKIAQGRGVGLTSGFYSQVVYDNGVTVQRWSGSGEKTFNAESGIIRWVGMRRKYVAVLLDFHKEIPDRIDAASWDEPDLARGAPRHYSLRVSGHGDDPEGLNFDVMVLPLQYGKMKAMGRNYEQILFSGYEWFFRADVWYPKLCGLVLNLLNLFYRWIPNYGIAIILLTLLVRLITMPLSVTQIRSTGRMAQHQPEIKKIQEKYKGDRQKSQAELMAYYQKQGINPLAPAMGCLPAMLQMPVFLALFNVLGRAVELRDAPFFGWIHDLARPDVILPAVQVPFLFPLGVTVLPFFMAASMWAQMKLTITDPNQKAMVWLMPIMMFVFSCSFPSGLVVYWTVSNLFTLMQTRIFKPKPLLATVTNGPPRRTSAKV